nr:MAG TPA: hypothetical protein [Caudoviricetes sp.]
MLFCFYSLTFFSLNTEFSLHWSFIRGRSSFYRKLVNCGNNLLQIKERIFIDNSLGNNISYNDFLSFRGNFHIFLNKGR